MTKAIIDPPIGAIVIEADDDRLRPARLTGSTLRGEAAPPGRLASKAAAQVHTDFAGRLKVFNLPLAPTAFDRSEAPRRAIAAIRFCETLSYGALAPIAHSGGRDRPGMQPQSLPLIVPCHRVLAHGDLLGHYSAANGLATRRDC